MISSLSVLLTCEDFFPHMGGAEVCVHNLRMQFKMAGHHVTLFTNTLERTNDEEGIVRVRWSFGPIGIARQCMVLWRLIHAADIVHCQYSFRIACLCALICRLQNKPMLLTQQGRGIVPEANPRLYHALLYRICQTVSMRGATLITSTSDEITALTAAFVPWSKIVSVTNGYDADRFSPDPTLSIPSEYRALSPDVRYLLTVRRLVPKNGIHILVQALALVRKQRSDFHYFAIGDGRVRGFIESLIEKHDLKNHVTLLGERSNDTIKAYYQYADLVLVPSSAEATSIACIEAMGMAKPIIASRVGGLIDLLGCNSEYGTLVSIYDSEACTYAPPDSLPEKQLQPLVDAILTYLSDPQPFIAKAQSTAPVVCQKYSWSAIAATYLSLYYQLLHLTP